MILEKLNDLIRKFEGLRLKPYLCPAGVPTIGYGHTGPEVSIKMKPITEPVAEAMMVQDAATFATASANLSPVLYFDSDKHSAIADFCFNLGTTRYKASTLRRKVNAGDWEGAQEELQKWVWGGGKKLPGLIARRKAEALLLK
ncbi:lysozyme [Quatrionicoccus australiensis]|uniref:lysozyme n=1 Tax=Quatrionicoccus australiensis TaxID=138118 RepID=UPI001CFC248B|nr:lysozyme [Quatrionicoccus australiensis]MCB4358431.1 lysozyme [Quatrionicoccus australiensis]